MARAESASAAGTSANGGAGAAGDAPLVLDREYDGLALVPQPTPLKRLNYFDGKFLRADDLRLEQDYLRELVALGNRAGGSGVVSGLNLTADGGRLSLSAGLAIDAKGRVLYLPHGATVDLARLIAASRPAPAAASTGPGGAPGFAACAATADPAPPVAAGAADLYQITLGPADALCGQADVYGKLCEDACATTSERPYRLDGVVLRAVPLSLPDARCTLQGLTRRHRRSQVAAAYFADERARLGAEMSGARLLLDLWCLGATAETGSAVPLAVVSVSGGALEWVDEWTARRERMQDPPLRYWQWQTGMRPLAVYWAQVLQFQCQLHEVLAGRPPGTGGDDPCATPLRLLDRAQRMLADLETQLAAARRAAAREDEASSPPAGGLGPIELLRPAYVTRIADLKGEVSSALTSAKTLAETRVLIDGGIVELPPAGWLPVVPGALDVNTQVKRLLGDGVDLRFCIVRPDYVPHAFEAAQHLERICLLEGLQNPASKPKVDVLVPDGVRADTVQEAGRSFEVTLRVLGDGPTKGADEATLGSNLATGAYAYAYTNAEAYYARAEPAVFTGAGRTDPLAGGAGGALRFAGQAKGPAAGSEPPRSMYAAHPLNALRRMFVSSLREGGVYAYQQINRPQVVVDPVPVVPPSLWTSMTCDANPFALEPGGFTAVRVEVGYADSAGTRLIAGELTLRGELYCDRGGRGTAAMRGRLKGSVERRLVGGGAAPGLPVNLEVALATRALSGGATGVTARLASDDGGGAEISVKWGREPLLAEGSLVGIDAEPDGSPPRAERRALASATGRENPAVRDAANPYHVKATQALGELQKALRDRGFKAYAERLLFPPARPKDAAVVRATRDWVLFHRRRVSSCDCCPEAAAPARRYRVYHVLVPERTTLETIRGIMRDARGVSVRPVEVYPTWVGESDVLLTPPAQVADAWKAAAPGTALLYGAVAGSGDGASDPDALLHGRLDRLAALVEETTPGHDPVLEVLHALDPDFRAEGADGVMVLVTARAAVVTNCHEVFSVGLVPGGVTLYAALEAAVKDGQLPQLMDRLQSVSLGTVDFATGSSTPGAGIAGVAGAWSGAGHGRVQEAVTLSPDVGDPARLRVAQAQAIADRLGGGADARHLVNVLTHSPPWNHCPAVTVLVPALTQPPTRTGRLVVRQMNALGLVEFITEPEWTVRFAADGSLVGGVDHALDSGLLSTLQSRRVTGLSLSPRQFDGTAAPPLRAKSVLDGLVTAQSARHVSLLQAGATAAALGPGIEIDLFDRGGIAVDDVVFLQAVGPQG
jgi:hypothetical protein